MINDFAQGLPGKIMDLVLVGSRFDHAYLDKLVRATEANVSFKIRYLTVTPAELPTYVHPGVAALKIWDSETARS